MGSSVNHSLHTAFQTSSTSISRTPSQGFVPGTFELRRISGVVGEVGMGMIGITIEDGMEDDICICTVVAKSGVD